jgi:hypothetical protein
MTLGQVKPSRRRLRRLLGADRGTSAPLPVLRRAAESPSCRRADRPGRSRRRRWPPVRPGRATAPCRARRLGGGRQWCQRQPAVVPVGRPRGPELRPEVGQHQGPGAGTCRDELVQEGFGWQGRTVQVLQQQNRHLPLAPALGDPPQDGEDLALAGLRGAAGRGARGSGTSRKSNRAGSPSARPVEVRIRQPIPQCRGLRLAPSSRPYRRTGHSPACAPRRQSAPPRGRAGHGHGQLDRRSRGLRPGRGRPIHVRPCP